MRETIYSTIDTEQDSIVAFDSMSCDFSTFLWENGYYAHKITSFEILKPYLISLAYYGTVIYEDMILLVNNIDDIFNVYPGAELKIPKLDDLKKFILANRK